MNNLLQSPQGSQHNGAILKKSESGAGLAGGPADEFLEAITVEYGPAPLLGRLFLKAVACAQNRGVTLALTTLHALERFNRAHMKDWPMLPVFQPAYQTGDAADAASFAILGRNRLGEIVSTQAARFFDWRDTTLKREAESLRMFYGDKQPPAAASCEVSSEEGGSIAGRVVYSGATWFRPDYRGRELSAILPRLSRALALTRWNTDRTISFMDWRIVKKGVAESYGYRNLGDGITLRNIVDPEFVAAVGWITQDELVQDAEMFLRDFPIDWANGVELGRRQNTA